MENLTANTFVDKVFDYRTQKDWAFKGDLPAIVDFYADWCGPCKIVAPILQELSTEFSGKLNIYKVNTEKEPELASAFGIQSIPSLLFIPIGEKPSIAAGALPENTFREIIRDLLKVH